MLKEEYSKERTILDLFSAKGKELFLSELKGKEPYKLTKILGEKQLYIKDNPAQEFFQKKEELIGRAEETLKWYCDWWLLGKNKVFSDPLERMKETEIMDPIENTTLEDFEKFHHNFADIYCCLIVLQTLDPSNLQIERVALNDPHDVPDFSNRDPWLQRTAFLFCLKKAGVKIIQDHYEKIRLELLYYVLLRNVLAKSELKYLKDLIQNQDHDVIAVDVESVLELIDHQILSKQ